MELILLEKLSVRFFTWNYKLMLERRELFFLNLFNKIDYVCVWSLWSLMDTQTAKHIKLQFGKKVHFSMYIILIIWIYTLTKISFNKLYRQTNYCLLPFFLWHPFTSISIKMNFFLQSHFIKAKYVSLLFNLII